MRIVDVDSINLDSVVTSLYQRTMPGKDEPLDIGNFSKPLVPPTKQGTTEAALKNAESRLDEDVQKDEAALKPMETYADRLREAGLDLEKAAKIVDAVLLDGYYAEDFPVTKNVKIRLRTRTARDTKRAQDILEANRPAYDHHYNEWFTRLLLAASLEQWGTDKLPHPTKKTTQEDIEKMFQERINYVDNTMSDPAMRIAFQKLFKFDRMVAVALEEGAIENF